MVGFTRSPREVDPTRGVLNKWWLPESGNASRCPDLVNRRCVSDFASVLGFFQHPPSGVLLNWRWCVSGSGASSGRRDTAII